MSDTGIQPLYTPQLTDYHMHCDYSVDAIGSIRDYCEASLKRRLAEICFTTHYDLNPESDAIDCYILINGQKHRTSVEHLAP